MSFDQLMQHAADIQRKAIDVTLKERHLGPYAPVEQPSLHRRGLRPPIKGEEAEIRTSLFVDIPELFQPFADSPDPTGFDRAIEAADNAAGLLNTGGGHTELLGGKAYLAQPVLAEYTSVKDTLLKWHGPAANEFRDNFLVIADKIVQNQFQLAIAIRAALEAEQQIWLRTRTDIDTLAHKVLHALDALDAFCTKDEWTMTFTVAASVAAVSATLATSGAAIGTITLVGAASQVAAAVPINEAPTNEYSAKTAEGVVNHLREAVRTIHGHIAEQESTLARGLSRVHQLVAAHPEYFLAPRPRLADLTSATAREHLGEAF